MRGESSGQRAVGVEIDADLIKQSNRNAWKAGVADRVRSFQQDLFKTDLSEATVVTLSCPARSTFRLRSRWAAEARPDRVAPHVRRRKPDASRNSKGRVSISGPSLRDGDRHAA
jgi:hypothetical protein